MASVLTDAVLNVAGKTRIVDIAVQIAALDVRADQMEIQVGPFGYTVSIEEFKKMATGEATDPRAIIRNVAIAAALNGIDVTDQDAMNKMLSTTTFKG